MDTTTLKDFLNKLNLGTNFKAKVYVHNELGYIVIIKTDSERFNDVAYLSALKWSIIRAIAIAFPEKASYVHLVLVNPTEWPAGTGRIQAEISTFPEDNVPVPQPVVQDSKKKPGRKKKENIGAS